MEGLDIKQMVTMVHSIADEKNLSEDEVMQAVEAAIAAAWRRDNGTREMNVRAELNREDGTAKVIVHYDVVETPEGIGQITLEEAKKIDKKALLGGVIEQEFEAKSFGRVAAQTAKQVLLQKLREFERETMANEYGSKIGKIITGTVIRVESRVIHWIWGMARELCPVANRSRGSIW